MTERGSQQINAGLTDLLELQVTLVATIARILDEAEAVPMVVFAEGLRESADRQPEGRPVRMILESLARAIGPEPLPRFEVIEGGKD